MLIAYRKREIADDGYGEWQPFSVETDSVILHVGGRQHAFRYSDDGNSLMYRNSRSYGLGDVSAEWVRLSGQPLHLGDGFQYEFAPVTPAPPLGGEPTVAAEETPRQSDVQQAWIAGYELGLRHSREMAWAIMELGQQ